MPHHKENKPTTESLPVREPVNEEESRTRTRACQRCRLMKRKCDGRDPCRSCVLIGLACTLSVDDEGPDYLQKSISQDTSTSPNTSQQPAVTALDVAKQAYLDHFNRKQTPPNPTPAPKLPENDPETFRAANSISKKTKYGILSARREERMFCCSAASVSASTSSVSRCAEIVDDLVIGDDHGSDEEDKLVSSEPLKMRGRPTAAISGVKTTGRPPRPK